MCWILVFSFLDCWVVCLFVERGLAFVFCLNYLGTPCGRLFGLWVYRLLDIASEIIEQYCVFMILYLKSLKHIVFSCDFIWNHWETLCFHAMSFEIIEKRDVFMLFHLTSLKTIMFHVISSEIIENYCVFMIFHLKSLKSIVFSCYFIWHH